MKKFLCRGLLFLLVACVLCHVINPVLNAYFAEGRNSRLNHRAGWIFGFHDQHFDFAVLGSSRTLNHVDIRTLEELGNGRGLNLSNSGAGYAQNYLVLRHFFNLNNRIDRLILNFDRDCFDSDSGYTDPFQEYAFLPFFQGDWKSQVFEDALPPSKFWLYRFLPTVRYLEYNDRYRVDLFQRRSYYQEPKADLSMGTDLLHRIDPGFTPTSLPESRPFRSVPDAVDLKYFRRIQDLCRSQGTELVLVSTPVFKVEADRQSHREATDWLASTAKEVGLAHFDYSYWHQRERFDYFFNRTHLNAEGALVFSREFGKDLIKSYEVRPESRID